MKSKNVPVLAGIALGTGVLSLALLRRYLRIQSEGVVWQKLRRPALEVLACPGCHAALMLDGTDGYFCPACQRFYPVLEGIPHFILPRELTGMNKRFAQIYDWASWGYRLFSKIAFAYIGMSEEQGRREVTDRLDPEGGVSWRCRSVRGSTCPT